MNTKTSKATETKTSKATETKTSKATETKTSKATAKAAAKKAVVYDKETALKAARKNGSALKVATVATGGEYVIATESRSGTPIALRKIYNANFPEAKSVPAADFSAAISAVLSSVTGIAALDKTVGEEKGKPYANGRTLLRRIKSEIAGGSILRFRLDK
jgi:hypothetical protein